MADDNENHGIYRVDTIPPPEGEDDAYSAPTKVGPMADAAVRELMQAAERRASELNAKHAAAAAAAASSLNMATPVSVKPAGLLSSSSMPASARSSAPPASGRSPVAPSAPRISRPSVPRPAAVPRIDPRAEPNDPPAPALTAPPPSSAVTAPPPSSAVTAPPPSDPSAPPRLYDEDDDSDHDDAATLLHKSARPPEVVERTAVLSPAQNPVHSAPPPVQHIPTPAPLPAVQLQAPLPPMSLPPPAPMVRPSFPPPREPIPFEPFREPPPPVPTPRLMLPLALGFLIFAIGLAVYVWGGR